MYFSDGTESVRLTHEQMRIVKYQPKSDEIIKIVAFAGMNFACSIILHLFLIADFCIIFRVSISRQS